MKIRLKQNCYKVWRWVLSPYGRQNIMKANIIDLKHLSESINLVSNKDWKSHLLGACFYDVSVFYSVVFFSILYLLYKDAISFQNKTYKS